MRAAACAALLISSLAAGAARAATNFEIDEYRVVGNTVLNEDTIDDTLYPFLGPGRTAADVEHARQALSNLYTARGYNTVFAQVPRQRVTDGVIVIEVVERHIGRLRVTGSRYFSPDTIRAQAPSLAPGSVPNIAAIKRDILALNQWPDRTITPVLKAGSTVDTVDVDLQVQDKAPVHASLEWNDRQSYHTTRTRLQGSVSYDNLWQRGDSLSASFLVAPMRVKDANVFTAAYQYRIPNSDDTLTLSYLHSGSHVATLGTSSVVGRGYDVGLLYGIPLRASGTFTDQISAGLDFKRFAQIIPGDLAGNNTPITYVPASLAYQAIWTTKTTTTTLAPSVVAGIAPLSNDAAKFSVGRDGANPDFIYFRLDGTRTQPMVAGTQLYLRVAGQQAMEPLVSNEQLALGGADTARGYLESEVLGDYGVFDQIEWRSPRLSLPRWAIDQYRGFLFYDTGKVWTRDTLPGEPAAIGLESAGFGLRANFATYLSAETDFARVLVSGPYTRAGTERFLFRLIGGF